MGGPVHGLIECLFLGTGQATGSAQTAFVNCYNFLNNNTGTLGIRRIAYNTGSQNTGMPGGARAMNYYNTALPAGDNAWACFCFQSASVPFYTLIQWTGTANSFGSAPGSPGLGEAAAGANTLAFAFAQRADGGNPWNGSSGSNGSDTKGTPVWHPFTSSLYLVPRSNDGVRSGAHAASKQNMLAFAVVAGSDWRMHYVADYDNFVFLHDPGNLSVYNALAFGVYTPLSGVGSSLPYFCFKTSAGLPFSPAQTTAYGGIAGNATANGGISYPNIALSGTCDAGLDRYGAGFFSNTNAQPNRGFATPMFNEMPILVGINETPNQVGALGQAAEFYREVYNVATHDTNGAGTRAVFGGTTVATVKLTIPWASGTVPGSGVTKVGVAF